LIPNDRFLKFKDSFINLVKQNCIVTAYDIITMTICNDGDSAIAVMKRDEFITYICMYNFTTYEMIFEEMIEGDCIKVREVEQNDKGDLFATVFNDDGKFRLRTFGKKNRSECEIKGN
jgi:hypothetical protein